MHETQRFAFGDFVLDLPERALLCRDESIPLAPKEFQLLHVLVSRAGHLVQKDELIRQVWADTFVTDSSLLRNISVLRKHLGHDSIRTMPKCGYTFVLPVVALGTQADIATRANRATEDKEPSPYPRDASGFEIPEGESLKSPAKAEFSARLVIPEMFHRPKQPNADLGWAWIAFRGNAQSAVAITIAVLTLSAGVLLRISNVKAPIPDSAQTEAITSEANSRASQLYVMNQGGKSLSVLPAAAHVAGHTFSLEADPRGAAILPDRSALYISLNGANRVVALNPRTNKIIANIPVGKSPVGVAANPRPPYVYVANNYSNTVSVIDARTNTVVRTLAVGKVPTEIAVTPDGTRAIVTNQSGGSITMIDSSANKVLATISVGSTPVGVTFSPNSEFAWVTLAGQNEVAVIDVAARQVVHYISVGLGPVRVVISGNGRYALISNFFSNTLSVVDTAAMRSIGTIQVGLNPVGVALDPAGVLGYAANFGSNTVSVIDMSRMKVIRTIDVGTNPVEMTMLPCYAIPCESPREPKDVNLSKTQSRLRPFRSTHHDIE